MRGPPAPPGAEKALELELERLGLCRLEPDVLDDLLESRGGEALPPGLQAIELARPLRQVEGEIPGRLKDPQLAGALPGDAARGHVRDGTVRELDAGVGDVHVRSEERYARGPDVRHVGAHQLEH